MFQQGNLLDGTVGVLLGSRSLLGFDQGVPAAQQNSCLFTLNKIECSKQAVRNKNALNMLAWDNGIGLWSLQRCVKRVGRCQTTSGRGCCLATCGGLPWGWQFSQPVFFVGFHKIKVMIDRNSRGHSYLIVRGEILGFIKDELQRKHLSRMFSLIKNES